MRRSMKKRAAAWRAVAAMCWPWAAAALLCAPAALAAAPPGNTPIQYLVVLYQENVSFDHYFATYPKALNPAGEPTFHARAGTPTVNGLSGPLLSRNPNSVAPFRFDRTRAATCDQDHEYTDEQLAYHGGLLDGFVRHDAEAATTHDGKTECQADDVMGYFDGNTVTALWNYAQHFALSDANFGTTFGPSTPGALNLVAGQTHGATGNCARATAAERCSSTSDTMITYGDADIVDQTIVGDPQPQFDDCTSHAAAAMSGPNVGLLLSQRGVRWGFFQGGFRPSERRQGIAVCSTAHTGSDGGRRPDYIPHHQPFQYFEATANPHHLPPTATSAIGDNSDAANHQYDLLDFWVAADHGHLPQVSFLKAPAYQDGHAGYSDPLAEQRYLVETINRLQRLPEWPQMAIIIAYDDSDGWYDHVMPPMIRASATRADALDAAGHCGGKLRASDLPGRCGLGPRLPLLVISAWARQNFVDHRVTEQASILRFVEDNWNLGRLGSGAADADAGTLDELFDFQGKQRAARLFLDPANGQPVRQPAPAATPAVRPAAAP